MIRTLYELSICIWCTVIIIFILNHNLTRKCQIWLMNYVVAMNDLSDQLNWVNLLTTSSPFKKSQDNAFGSAPCDDEVCKEYNYKHHVYTKKVVSIYLPFSFFCIIDLLNIFISYIIINYFYTHSSHRPFISPLVVLYSVTLY